MPNSWQTEGGLRRTNRILPATTMADMSMAKKAVNTVVTAMITTIITVTIRRQSRNNPAE